MSVVKCVAVVLLSAAVLLGSRNLDGRLVGKWAMQGEPVSIRFMDDGSARCTFAGGERPLYATFYWRIGRENILVITGVGEEGEPGLPNYARYQIEGDVLTLDMEQPTIFSGDDKSVVLIRARD